MLSAWDVPAILQQFSEHFCRLALNSSVRPLFTALASKKSRTTLVRGGPQHSHCGFNLGLPFRLITEENISLNLQ